VYLHQPAAFAAYLARLHLLAGTKPVLLGECGIDSRREGEPRQAELLRSLLEVAFQGGVAGAVVYSFTDEWFKDGQVITDWQFGLTTRERRPKAAFATVREAFHAAPHFPLAQYPRVSVVVACYNGARTLRACLDSLGRLNYPDYEILLVDDGSTDATPQIASLYPAVRCLRHPSNTGLSAARNTGLAAATGEVLAFTDADCRADEDWLYHLVGTLLRGRFAGVGGPNLLPPEDSAVAAAVLVSPGGPAHVMLTDRVAEHLPGCNMAFWKSALLEVGCFDPVFRRAGDDVDICWRLQQNGYALGFSPAGFVWHYRRSTVRDYLKQQRGYGEAEALLERKHPENFSRLGGSIWRGRIYSQAQVGLVTRRPIIYHGLFGGALFQRIYTAPPPATLMVLTSLEYHVFVTAPLIVLAVMVPWLTPLVAASGAISFGVCLIAAAQADVPARQRRFWSRPLVALLFGLQPLARGWARYQGRLFLRQQPLENCESLDSLSLHQKGRARDEVQYAAPPGFARSEFLARALARLDRQGWLNRTDTGWGDYDLEVYGSRWTKLQLTTAAEYYPGGQLLRCRLRPAFTLAARLVFWSLLGLALLATGLAGSQRAWLWLLLLGAPVFALWLHREQRSLQRWFGVFLDKVAEEVGLAPAAVSAGIASAVPAGFPGCAGRAGPRRHESKDHHHAEEGGARSAG
jgi:GT2 family glycosyltransferase